IPRMTDPPALLDGLRVLDLATPRAEYAGRVLADLGAEVLKVEPPGGAEARRLPPFDERPGHEGRSLAWAALALGKRSVVIDLDAEAGRERLRALAARADVLLESHDPGWMAARGLGFEALAAVNLALVYVSVAPFGQAGPKSAWPATDLTLEAACGRMSIQGDLDRVPVPVGYPQAAFHAGAQAAADALIALNERALSGRGQHLDTSIQAVMVWTLMDGTGYPTSQGADPPGGGEDRAHAGPGGRTAAPIRCRDGWVIATVQPMQLGAMMPGVIAGLGADATAEVAGADWAAFARMLERGVVEPNEYRLAVGALSQLVATRTKAELIAWAAQHDVQLAPVNTARDLLGDEQLAARGYWREVGDLTHAGPPALLSRTLIRYARAAPALGEGEEVAARWLAGDRPPFAPDPFALSRSTGAGGPGEASNARTGPAPSIPFPFAASASSGPSAPSASKREGGGDPDRLGEAFAGLRVADFSWVAAGPIVVKALADHGATVVRVESATRLDLLRRLPPFKDGVPGPNRAYWYNNVNTSKLGLALDLSTAEGRGVARRLVDWADVVVESFTPGTMARFGLGYGAVSHERPDLIMLSTCLLGQTGPRATYAGYGSHGAAIAGLHAITGWPDRPPTGPAGPYTDVVAPRLAVPL
ncbi:MAG: hypothetical protein FJZ92_14415, partial [Chloroflexi bacterium]|nr:hypothetical protein [Chloroflexota bacterium]